MNFEFSDRVSISQLCDRYRLSRGIIYKRLSALRVRPERIGLRAYVENTQLALLDALHEFIQGGGTTAEFLRYRGLNED
jgi:hypothetical protein